MSDTPTLKKRTPFPKLYWLVVMFEFFERGSYYGMMSVLSVYMTDVLNFSKQDVGVVKATIQPLLYFLPILTGALADRFGYRRTLMVAFSLLGGGYFLTSQATQYTWVFLSLVVMGLGAGTFKPVISGTIARCTDETNSTLGFGIFYWSINLGAFLFPTILVPLLKNNVGWHWIIIAAAIGTGAMLLPTIFIFREPPSSAKEEDKQQDRPNLLQTLANAFEIIYSPLVLLSHLLRRSPGVGGLLLLLLLGVTLGYGGWLFGSDQRSTTLFSARAFDAGGTPLVLRIERNLNKPQPFQVETRARRTILTLHDPDQLPRDARAILAGLAQGSRHRLSAAELTRLAGEAARKTTLELAFDSAQDAPFVLSGVRERHHRLSLRDADVDPLPVVAALAQSPDLSFLDQEQLAELMGRTNQRPFFLPFVGLLLLAGLVALALSRRFRAATGGGRLLLLGLVVGGVVAVLWGLELGGQISLFAAILCTVISSSLAALFAIDHDEPARFKDHFRFLSMIFIYSGFWVLYFQMFDSVLWYVQAYVDATSLNNAVNGLFGTSWHFDVEHVTSMNALTIIVLQLIVSYIVKNTRALPTMVVGIGLGTAGMAVLALSTSIWVFLLGITIFSIGEMTAHPKFISYVGQTAPKNRVAMYMGYVFLYGVIGSSIGSMVGANLYVTFVDQLNQPRTLWLIFAGIGVATIVGLLLYNAVVGKQEPQKA